MKLQPVLIALTLVNAVMLTVNLVRPAPSQAQAANQVLRGTGLEIVDNRGRPRATISIIPADPNVRMPDGSRGVPETVLLRLIDAGGRPSAKLAASNDAAGISLTPARGDGFLNVTFDGGTPKLKLVNAQGKEHVVAP